MQHTVKNQKEKKAKVISISESITASLDIANQFWIPKFHTEMRMDAVA